MVACWLEILNTDLPSTTIALNCNPQGRSRDKMSCLTWLWFGCDEPSSFVQVRADYPICFVCLCRSKWKRRRRTRLIDRRCGHRHVGEAESIHGKAKIEILPSGTLSMSSSWPIGIQNEHRRGFEWQLDFKGVLRIFHILHARISCNCTGCGSFSFSAEL